MTRYAAALVRSLRPRHWLKNGFVLAPAVFSGHALDAAAVGRSLLATAAFCLAASAGYLINDLLDREADRLDPVKRDRPIADGALGAGHALGWAFALLAVAAGIAMAVSRPVALALLVYTGLTLMYSLALKSVAILEAIVLATGFVVRLAAGALAIPVMISHWLVVCGFLLALLLAFGKRVPELRRPALRTPAYPESFLRAVVTLLAGVTLVTYVLYTVSPDTVANLGSRALLLTVPLVLFGILRYLLLLHREGAQDPAATLLGDRPLLLTVVAWALLAAVIVVRARA
jgi:decaprenyl-phosphate phosphoribosyltransferase